MSEKKKVEGVGEAVLYQIHIVSLHFLFGVVRISTTEDRTPITFFKVFYDFDILLNSSLSGILSLGKFTWILILMSSYSC